MPDNFSLNDLFKTGLNKDQFKAGFLQERNNNELEDIFSIFGDNIEGSVDNIFDEVDSDKDGEINAKEFNDVAKKFNDNNQNDISINDVQALYIESIMKMYSSHSPKEIYESTAEKEDIKTSNIIEDLDNKTNSFDKLINARSISSENKIRTYQNQIDSIVKDAAIKRGLNYTEYEEYSQKSNSLDSEYRQTHSEINKKEEQLNELLTEKNRLEKELKELKSDSENNKVEIEGVEYELDNINSQINDITDSISDLKSKIKTVHNNLKVISKKRNQIQKNILKHDKKAQDKVQELKNKIKLEEKQANEDIKRYQNGKNLINKVKDYTINRIKNLFKSSDAPEADFSNTGKNCPSLKDVNYSAEKGKKLANYMRNHAVGFTGHCSRYVANGIAATGLGHERAPSAHMMDQLLAKNSNYKEITVSSKEELKNLPAGCIIVYEAGAREAGAKRGYNAIHGHIEVTLGNGTAASDGITRNIKYTEGQMHVFVPVD